MSTCTHILELVLGNEPGEVEFPFVVGEEVPALGNCLALQRHGQRLAIFTMFGDNCRARGEGWG